jgi:hypothetical protein
MNTQQSIVKQALHFKVEYNNEYRRFFLNTPTFAEVEKTLKTLFSINETSAIKIKFLDDEKDWVNLSTDQELQYAVELVERPLRLSVTVASVSPDSSSADTRPCMGGKGRWNREKCGGKWKDGEDASLSKEERMARKNTRLSSRIAQLEAKLASGELPADRTRVLTWRLSVLREKLANVQAQQNAVTVTAPAADVPESAVEAMEQEPTPQEPTPTPTEAPARGRGCRGRGGRGGGCRGRGGRKNLDADAPPSLVFVCKTNLKAARQAGNVEEMKKCREALWEAKQMAKEERGLDLEDSKLFREKKQYKRACKQNLLKARESGDVSQIKICREELVKAKKACWEVRQAKRESNQ